MSDIEGAICDECGQRIGPMGCCGTVRTREAEIARLRAEVEAQAQEVAALAVAHEQVRKAYQRIAKAAKATIDESIGNARAERYNAENRAAGGTLGPSAPPRIEARNHLDACIHEAATFFALPAPDGAKVVAVVSVSR